MKTVKFTKDFPWSPSKTPTSGAPQTTLYTAGMEVSVTEACAAEAVEKGYAEPVSERVAKQDSGKAK